MAPRVPTLIVQMTRLRKREGTPKTPTMRDAGTAATHAVWADVTTLLIATAPCPTTVILHGPNHAIAVTLAHLDDACAQASVVLIVRGVRATPRMSCL